MPPVGRSGWRLFRYAGASNMCCAIRFIRRELMNIDKTLRVVARQAATLARGRAGLAQASQPAPTLLILLLAVLALAACNPVESRSDSSIRDAVQNFASEECADPSS